MKTLLTFVIMLFAFPALSQTLAEQARIIEVLEGQTRASMDRDAEKAASYYAKKPYVAVSYQEPGSGYIRGYDRIREALDRTLGDKPEKSNRKLYTGDYHFRIYDDHAWVTYTEMLTPANGGEMEKIFKACYLEKIDNTWKIVGNHWMAGMKSTQGTLASDQ